MPESVLKEILKVCFIKNEFQKPDTLNDFLVASLLMQSKISVIVLLAGTSGTGKSTLASLLGTRLGISSVLSTDSIRHVMRNFVSEKDAKVLFCSTYEAGDKIEVENREQMYENQLTLMGYKEQCKLVQNELAKVINRYQERNESLIVEGVHLTVTFLKEMMAQYSNCIPFVLYIKSKKKHGARFAVRAKHMTIDPRFNKYVKSLQSIRCIQEYLTKKAEEVLIPRVENHNVDRSISLIQTTIWRCLQRIEQKKLIYDSVQKRATGIHKVILSIQKNQLSSKQAQNIIKSKVNKEEVIEKYLESATQGRDLDPEHQKRLQKTKLGNSFSGVSVNIWAYDDDEKNQN